MSAKHTPGPWRVEPELGPRTLILAKPQRTALMGDFRGSHVAEVLCNTLALREEDDVGAADRDEVAANAKLIAAAPALADALEALLNSFTKDCPTEDAARGQARTALRLAGRLP